MAFTVEDFQDLVRLLAQHPEWRSELRRLLLSEELLTVPERLARVERLLAELVQRDEERSRQLAGLIEAVRENTRQIAELRETVAEHSRQIAELRETVAEHSRQIAEQTRQIEGLRETVLLLAQRLDTVAGRTDMALGELLELRAERRLSSWLGRFLRGLRVRPPGEWEREFRPLLSPAAFDRLLDADLLARGRLTLDGQREVWLAIEVSRVIDAEDVARAQEWAQLLREVGLVAVPVVLGAALTGEAREAVERERVLFVEATLQRVWVHGWEAVRERWVA
jgi:archaellum component FlaC